MKRKGLVSPAGLATLEIPSWKFEIPDDVAEALKANPAAYNHFRKFSLAYRTIRVGWIAATKRPAERAKRLRYFIAMTAKGKKFGMVQ